MKRAEEWCASGGNIPYFETFVKDDYNVDAAFHHVAQLVLHSDLPKQGGHCSSSSISRFGNSCKSGSKWYWSS
ncbi:unnamed protein product [Musa acuminata subsp. malaccensis]|nr:unnamed protein product [Musa acuminata subsp. malaccensis]